MLKWQNEGKNARELENRFLTKKIYCHEKRRFLKEDAGKNDFLSEINVKLEIRRF